MENFTKLTTGVTKFPTAAALSSSGIEFDLKNAPDEKIIFIVEATATDTVTVKGGKGVFEAGDKTFNIPSGNSILRIETGAFKKAGVVTLCGASTTKVSAVVAE